MVTNKTILPIVFFFGLSAFACKEEQKIEKITFHYVDLEIETPFDVSCSHFENFFSDGYRTVAVRDNNKLKQFANYLMHCKILDSTKNIDVRIKIIITYANKKSSVLCADKFYNLVLDNKSINANQNIVAFIKKQINK